MAPAIYILVFLDLVLKVLKDKFDRHVVYQLQDQAVADEKVPFSFQVGSNFCGLIPVCPLIAIGGTLNMNTYNIYLSFYFLQKRPTVQTFKLLNVLLSKLLSC